MYRPCTTSIQAADKWILYSKCSKWKSFSRKRPWIVSHIYRRLRRAARPDEFSEAVGFRKECWNILRFLEEGEANVEVGPRYIDFCENECLTNTWNFLFLKWCMILFFFLMMSLFCCVIGNSEAGAKSVFPTQKASEANRSLGLKVALRAQVDYLIILQLE